jgi:hypothetical protein
MKYSALLYPIVLVKIPNIDANSPQEALDQALARLQAGSTSLLPGLFNREMDGKPISYTEYSGRVERYVIDETTPSGDTILDTLHFAHDGVTCTRSERHGFIEDKDFTHEAWRQEVAEENTRLGYEDWVVHQRVGQSDEAALPAF